MLFGHNKQSPKYQLVRQIQQCLLTSDWAVGTLDLKTFPFDHLLPIIYCFYQKEHKRYNLTKYVLQISRGVIMLKTKKIFDSPIVILLEQIKCQCQKAKGKKNVATLEATSVFC